jgi:hypothetical protein
MEQGHILFVEDSDGDGLPDGDELPDEDGVSVGAASSVYSNISDINFNISSLELEPINYNLIKITLDLDYRI